MNITLTMTADEARFVLQVLGNLPTSSNAWPLMQKIGGQIDGQSAQAAEPAK